jgi:hypothetical protein
MLRVLVQDLEKKVELDKRWMQQTLWNIRFPFVLVLIAPDCWCFDPVNGLIVSARNGRTGAVKENNLRRLREAATLHHLLTCDV